jgi:hypothetical protein
MAVTFTSSSFVDGDVLTADDLNNLLNTNFNAAETAINDLEDEVAGKLDRTGGSISGRTDVSATASSSGTGDVNTVFRASNSGTSGSAAVFQSTNDDNVGAVSIKQQGAGPALSLKSNGGGPLIAGASVLQVTFVVEDTGTIRLGNMGTSGANPPTLELNAETGTVTNNVGSGLPLAFGTVSAAGVKVHGTDNWTVTPAPGGTTYWIKLDGVGYDYHDFVTIATPYGSNNARSITAGAVAVGPSGDSEIAITPRNASGTAVSDTFYFVVYQAP